MCDFIEYLLKDKLDFQHLITHIIATGNINVLHYTIFHVRLSLFFFIVGNSLDDGIILSVCIIATVSVFAVRWLLEDVFMNNLYKHEFTKKNAAVDWRFREDKMFPSCNCIQISFNKRIYTSMADVNYVKKDWNVYRD